jgi:hypothetical protein
MSDRGTTQATRLGGRLLAAAVTVAGTVAAAADPPAVKRLFPPGGAAGATVVVKAEGTFPRWPVQVWTDRPGTAWKPLEEKGAFEVAIAAEGALGLHRVRIHDAAGAAALRRFVVGGETEVVEAEPNNRPAEAQRLSSLPVTVNGTLEKAGDVDCFAVALEAGQTLVASLDAHGALASPVDAVLEVVGETGGYLARNLDARGLDPRVVLTARRAGTVVVRVYGFPADPNQTIALAGSSDYVYRLTLSTGPVVAAALPMAVTAGAATQVAALSWISWISWNGPADRPVREVTPAVGATSVVLRFDGMAGTVELPVVSTAVATAVAAGDVAAAAAVVPPVTVAGWFDEPGREAAARITAKKDASLLVTIEARADGSEAEALLDIRDAAGAVVLAKTDRDGPFAWKPPADGDYTFVVRDRRGAAGPGHFFRVVIVPERPELRATTEADAVVGKIGGTADVVIAVERLRGWKQPVEFVLVDPPAGVSAAPVTSAVDGDTAKKVTLAIAATGPYAGPVAIAARIPAAEGAAAETVATVVSGKERLPVVWLTVPPAAEEPKKP